MATDTLPEDDITKDGAPLSPGEQADFDQIEKGLQEGDTGHDPNTDNQFGKGVGAGWQQQPSNIAGGFFKSNRKKLFVAGAGLGGFAGIAVIFFLLMLFKNVHMKELFMAYEFAKFNRGFNKRITAAINEAQPKGNAKTTIAADASPEAQLNAANAEKVSKLRGDVKAQTEVAKQARAVDVRAGSGAETRAKLALDDGVTKPKGKNSSEVKDDVDKTIKDEMNKNAAAKEAPNNAAREAVNEAKDELDNGGSPKAVGEAAQRGFLKGMSGVVSKIGGIFAIATLGCIVRDIYVQSYDVFVKAKYSGLAAGANSLAKTADCQKLGECSLDQINAVAAKCDNGDESCTQSAGYQRAVGKPVTGQDLDPALMPNSPLAAGTNGDLQTALKVADAFGGALNLGGVATGCDFILNPVTQVIGTSVNVILVGVLAATGSLNFGASTVAVMAGQTALAVISTKIGTALAIDAATHYGGILFKQDFSPIQWGNIYGAGFKAMAVAGYQASGARELSPEENTEVALAIHADMIKEQKARGLAYRMFGRDNPVSTLGLIADRTPTTPKSAMAAMGRFFGTVLNPTKLSGSLASLLNPAQPAWAASTEYYTYGIPDYGFTDEELDKYGVVENSQWVEANIPVEQQGRFDKCFKDSITDIMAKPNDYAYCKAKPGDSEYENLLRYRLYKLDQRATHSLVLLYNDQPGVTTTSSPTSTPTTAQSTPTGPLPTGDAKQLAQQIIDNPRIDKSMRLVLDDFQRTARGEVTASGVALDPILLKMMVVLGQQHSYRISSLSGGGSGHSPRSMHYVGKGVDIDQLDGQPVSGRNGPSITIINLWAPIMSAENGGGRFGQSQCGATPALPAGVTTFTDICHHLHVDLSLNP